MKNNSAESPQDVDLIREVSLWQMIYLNKGSLARRFVHAVFSVALRLFFRRIETSGVEKVPQNAPIIFVLNHPNGIIDAALIFVSLARRVSFLAKSTLFTTPVIGFIIRSIESLPLFRRVDGGDKAENARRNMQTFDSCQELLARGRCVAVFPEGVSHDATTLQPIKTGTARIALGALSVGKNRGELATHGLKVMAVGLYYTSKTRFCSEVLLHYGEIIDVEPVELDENQEPPRESVVNLTENIKRILRNATLNFDNQSELEAVTNAEVVFASVYNNLIFKETLAQTFARLQDFAGKFDLLKLEKYDESEKLREKVRRYDEDLRESGLTYAGFSILQYPGYYVFWRLIVRGLLLILLAPFAIVGAIIHFPAYLFSNLASLLVPKHGVDIAGSTSKILMACLLMPLTWLITVGVIFYFFGWQIALIALPATIALGYIALRVLEEAFDMTIWIRAAWVLLRDRALFLRLLIRRRQLQKEISAIIES
ncbi:MAG: 1-acyl-sn-glycerol-3-phosphate acyltransferase [Pyrinomonadaceae bacterium]|nr:1-acyl-sn-glycerol-3-phosphate acyltransferase [Pyrinomonadaceae bacterium]